MRKRDINLYKNSKIENVIIFVTGILLFSIGFLFIGVALLLIFFRVVPFWMNMIMLCAGIIVAIIGHLYLFNYPYVIVIKDDFFECDCFLKKWKVKWEEIVEIKRLPKTIRIYFSSISPLNFIIKIRNKPILFRYLLLPYVCDIKGFFLFDSGKANFEMEEEIKGRSGVKP